MSRWRKLIPVLCIAAVAALSALDHAGVFGYSPPRGNPYDCRIVRVVRVIDGDTLDVSLPGDDGEIARVRLCGIDCPEIAHSADTDDAFSGLQAAAFVEDWIENHEIRLVFDPNHERFDKYGRLLAYACDAESGEVLNQLLIERGLAYADRRFAHMFRLAYERCEKRAARDKVGLWAEITPDQMPEWRQRYADAG